MKFTTYLSNLPSDVKYAERTVHVHKRVGKEVCLVLQSTLNATLWNAELILYSMILNVKGGS